MNISLTEAKARLTDLVRRAEQGEEVVLTRHGRPAARIVPAVPRATADEKEALLDALHGAGKKDFGPDATRAADFLYDDDGLPA